MGRVLKNVLVKCAFILLVAILTLIVMCLKGRKVDPGNAGIAIISCTNALEEPQPSFLQLLGFSSYFLRLCEFPDIIIPAFFCNAIIHNQAYTQVFIHLFTSIFIMK